MLERKIAVQAYVALQVIFADRGAAICICVSVSDSGWRVACLFKVRWLALDQAYWRQRFSLSDRSVLCAYITMDQV